jgi:hypothetical protein
MFPVYWFFFIIPALIVLLVILPNMKHLMVGFQKKDIWIIALIVVVAIGVCVAFILYWNYGLHNEINLGMQKTKISS